MASYVLLVGAVFLTIASHTQAQRPSRNPCARVRCLNRGTCSAPDDVPRCLCPKGFTGDRCQTKTNPIIRNPCRNFLCKNGGTCTAPADAPSCICAPGFFGTNCEYNRDPCFNFQCLNGGSCTAPADAPYCECPKDFTGKKCETRISGGGIGQCPIVDRERREVCGGIFCSSDTVCPTGQKCCASGCGRKQCTVVDDVIFDPCRNFICKNGGTCTAPADAPSCICAPGFFGNNCEYNRDPCFNFQCLNGGRCTAPADAPYCECPKDFTGKKCETRISGGGTGQCPNSTVGVCGGIMCSSDSECPTGTLCCTSQCGRKLCTNVTADQVGTEDLSSLCALIDCIPDRICRVTLPCNGCEPVAACVPLSSIGEGIDLECRRQNFFLVLLEKSTSLPENYSQVKCRGPLATTSCPAGSVCVDDLRGGGTCCFGKPLVVDNPGACPAVKLYQARKDAICRGGQFCDTDDQCAGSKKCCESSCGGRICTEPEVVTQGPICPGGCPKGYTCEYRGVPCKPGMFCIQIVRPTCVPPTDECGGCAPGERCEVLYPPCAPPQPCDSLNKMECIQPVCEPIRRCVPIRTTPAPTDECGGCAPGERCEVLYPPCAPPPPCDSLNKRECIQPVCEPIRRCVPIRTTPAPVDPCGGCGKGQVCIDTGIRCVTTPCPTFQCVTNNSCGGCPPGQSCQKLFPPCLPPTYCDEILKADPTAECTVPECKPIDTCVLDPVNVDDCGGCPTGQTCQPTRVVCKQTPCPSFSCVPNLVTEPSISSCNLTCPKNTVCELIRQLCPAGRRCAVSLVPQCTPIQLASCPKVIPTLERCPKFTEKEICSSDEDCNVRLNQRCCPTNCNTRVCTKVPRLEVDG